MSLFSKLLKQKASWQFAAEGTVWKLLYAGNVLLGDARDLEKHTSAFFAIDIQTGTPLWKNLVLPQAWWIGMQTVIGETLLLHGFEKPDMPIPKGMYAIDIPSGRILWHDTELTYLFTANNREYAQRATLREKNFFEIDVRSGATLYDYGTNEEGILQLRNVAGTVEELGCVFAESLQTRSDAVRAVVEKNIDSAATRGVIDVAEIDDWIIVAYHEPAKGAGAMLNNRVTNKLKIISTQGSIVFEDTLVANAPAPVPDVFFVKDHVLLYVKEATRVTGVRLNELQR